MVKFTRKKTSAKHVLSINLLDRNTAPYVRCVFPNTIIIACGMSELTQD